MSQSTEPSVCCGRRSHKIIIAPHGLVHCYDCGLNKPPENFQIGVRGKPSSPCIPSGRRSKTKTTTARTWAWAKRHPEKRAAHQAVTYAIRAGLLSRKPCESCGNLRSQAHHEDYTRKLDVKWLCAACHKKEHRKYV